MAIAQTNWVGALIADALGVTPQIVPISSTGDLRPVEPLDSGVEVGLFTRALEDSLIEGRADIAVHSLKDLPLKGPDGLIIAAFPQRGHQGELLLIHPTNFENSKSNEYIPIRLGTTFATGSPRRRAIMDAFRPDLNYIPLRGNVTTRIKRLISADFGATMIAEAGVRRLNIDLSGLIQVKLPLDRFVPAPGQGALAVQMRRDDPRAAIIARHLNDPETEICCRAERHLLALFGGGCAMPIGAAVLRDNFGFIIYAFRSSGSGPRWATIRSEEPFEGVVRAFQELTAKKEEFR